MRCARSPAATAPAPHSTMTPKLTAHTHTHTHTQVRTHTHTHIHTHTHTHTFTRTRTHTWRRKGVAQYGKVCQCCVLPRGTRVPAAPLVAWAGPFPEQWINPSSAAVAGGWGLSLQTSAHGIQHTPSHGPNGEPLTSLAPQSQAGSTPVAALNGPSGRPRPTAAGPGRVRLQRHRPPRDLRDPARKAATTIVCTVECGIFCLPLARELR